MSYKALEEPEKLVRAMRELVLMGLVNPRGGNGSIKVTDWAMLITPSGLAKQWLTRDDLVMCDLLSGECNGSFKPSIEVNAHAAVYNARPEAKAVLHAHPPLTLALASKEARYPNWWKDAGLVEVQYSVGEVAVAHPHPPGSAELAREVAHKVAEGAKAVVVPYHGVFAWGVNVEDAMDTIVALESVAKYLVARILVGARFP